MSSTQDNQILNIIGSTEYIDVVGIRNIPVKIDTGADSSAIWASNIIMREDGVLVFTLFDQDSSFYTGERLETSDYVVKSIRSSNGMKQIRYRVKLSVTIKDKTFQTTFTLADRSKNHFPVLIGRRTLNNKFIVDVSKTSVERPKTIKTARLNQELKENPYRFHQKYINS